MNIQDSLSKNINDFLKTSFEVDINNFDFQQTRKEFKGDLTLVVFPLLKYIKTNPVKLGEAIGEYLKSNTDEIEDFNVIKGFLNLSYTNDYFLNKLDEINKDDSFGYKKITKNAARVMVEFSSPNTNKPLHLGHIRNNLLGFSIAEILKANGNQVFKTQIINDRGIHICKSMLAWKIYGNGETPNSTGIKGDHLVGKYYVKFDQIYKTEINQLIENGVSKDKAEKQAPSLLKAQELLQKWEANDPETVELWKMMNQWVYDGFEKTYKELSVNFDKNYYESETYILGKDEILKGLKNAVFFKKEDGSVWIDLSEEGLDEKLVLRSDGTSVYMTQDIGTAIKRVQEFNISSLIYTVGNEQDYHFKVLFIILKKLGYTWAKNLYHLSYGMVELPEGKMKSREGTVVDADHLIEDMVTTAKKISNDLGKIDDLSEDERQKLYNAIGKGALKYFILKVDPRKNMLFDPKESIDFQGNTGPFIQYAYARIQSLISKFEKMNEQVKVEHYTFNDKEKELLNTILLFPETIEVAARELSPANICNYTFDLVQKFNSFYQNNIIIEPDDMKTTTLRINIASEVAKVIHLSLKLLGVETPRKM